MQINKGSHIYTGYVVSKIILPLLIVAMIATACSKTDSSKIKTPETNEVPSPTSVSVIPENNEAELEKDQELGDPVVITFAIEETSRSTYEKLAEKFHQQNPSISVQIVTPPDGFTIWNDEDLRPLASFADTAILFGGRGRFVNNPGVFLELTSMTDADSSFRSEDFWKDSLSACEDNEGRIVGVPITLTLMEIFYDPKAFDQAGLPHPYPGWTWSEFQKAVTAFAENSAGQATPLVDSTDFASSILAPFVDFQLLQHQGKIDSTLLSNSLGWYIEFGRAKKIVSFNPSENGSLYSTPSALWIGPMNASLPSDDSRLAVETYKIAPFPSTNDQNTNSNVIWPSCAVVSSGTKNPRAAWEWINFLSLQWPYENLPSSSLSPQLPARQSVATQIRYWDNVPDELKDTIHYSVEHGWYGTVYPQAFQTIRESLIRALDGENFASLLANATIQTFPTPDTNPIVVATPVPQPAFNNGNRIIRYLYPSDLADGSQRYQSFVEEFQRMHPDITVQISSDFSWPGGDILPYLVADFDCFYAGMDTISQPGLLYSLNDYIAREDAAFTKDFYPGRIEAFQSGDQIYGLPASNILSLIYYNADLLAQKSLQPPPTDWTFEDLLRLSNAVSSGSSSGPVFGTGGTEDLFFASRDVHWVDFSGEPPNTNFTQPSTIEAVNWFTQLTQTGVVYPLFTDRANSLNQAISGGQVAFWSGLSRQGNTNAFSFRYGLAPVPALSSSTGGIGWLMGSGQFISRQSQNPEACWNWMKYLSQKVAAFPDVPARVSVLQSSDYAAMVGKETASVYDAAQRNSQKAEMSLTLGPIRQWTWQALTSIFQGNDIHGTLNEAQQKTEVYLGCLDTAGLLHKEILSASPANRSQREQIGVCARQADPAYINLLLP